MRLLILLIWLLPSLASAAPYVEAGWGGRYGAFDTTIGYNFTPNYAIETTWINEGRQPNGIPNRNQVWSFDVRGNYYLTEKLHTSLKAGISEMKQSNHGEMSGFNGYKIGLSIGYDITSNIYGYGGITLIHTMQEIKEYENFNYTNIGLGYRF